jgi:hypothetical protein
MSADIPRIKNIPSSSNVKSLLNRKIVFLNHRCDPSNVRSTALRSGEHLFERYITSPIALKIMSGFCDHVKKYQVDIPSECCICCESLDSKDKLECGHYVHRDCIKQNINIRGNAEGSKCPLCRQTLPLECYF